MECRWLIAGTNNEQFNNRGIVAMANAGPDTNKSQVGFLLADLASSAKPTSHSSSSHIKNNRVWMASIVYLESELHLNLVEPHWV
jgi:cyclophilin family peptidyl-prolyl cis-trans isomerase